MNLPNLLSLLRIILTPLFIIFLFSEFYNAKLFSLFIFIIAAITDGYDGYLARKYNQITPEGKFLDPLADKVLVLSAFIAFAYIGIIDFWMVSIIIFRDLFVTGLRIIMSSKGFSFITTKISKYKTAFQLTIIIITLIFISADDMHVNSLFPIVNFIKDFNIIYCLTFLMTIFTAYTGINYVYMNRIIIQKYINDSND